MAIAVNDADYNAAFATILVSKYLLDSLDTFSSTSWGSTGQAQFSRCVLNESLPPVHLFDIEEKSHYKILQMMTTVIF
jgi:hypothetical protein